MTSDLNSIFGHRPIYICGKAATTIPNSSFEQSFHPQSMDAPSHGLTLNPEPQTFNLQPYSQEIYTNHAECKYDLLCHRCDRHRAFHPSSR